MTSSGARSSKPLRDLSVWLSQCWSLLMSDGTKPWVRWMSQSDTVVLVCQQGHPGRNRNWPRPRQQFCHRSGQALSSGWAFFCPVLVSLASCRFLSSGKIWFRDRFLSQFALNSSCSYISLSSSLAQSIQIHRGPASSPDRLAEGGFG